MEVARAAAVSSSLPPVQDSSGVYFMLVPGITVLQIYVEIPGTMMITINTTEQHYITRICVYFEYT
ncbi:MAG: hypothetical protein ABJM98_22005 [Ekhidna sp.]